MAQKRDYQELTFYSVAGGKYRCNQIDNEGVRPMTKKQMVHFVHNMVNNGQAQVLRIGPAEPPKSTKQRPKKHASKYAKKHR